MNIQNVTIHTAKNNSRYATYTIEGRGKACTFIPKACENVQDVINWLSPVSDLGAVCDSLNTDWEGEAEWRINLWENYGKRRVYVNLHQKCNGGKNWNGGMGGEWFIDLDNDCALNTQRSWAGAKTRKCYADDLERIIDTIRAAA